MIDLSYSNTTAKHISYVFICIVLSFLLVASMFRAEAIAYAKDNIDISFLQVGENNEEDKTNQEILDESDKEQGEDSLTSNEDAESEEISNSNLSVSNNATGENTANTLEANKDVDSVKDENLHNEILNSSSDTSQQALSQERENLKNSLQYNSSSLLNDHKGNVASTENNSNNGLDVSDKKEVNDKEEKSTVSEKNDYPGNLDNWKRESSFSGGDSYWWNKDAGTKGQTENEGDGTEENPFLINGKVQFWDYFGPKNGLKSDAKHKNQNEYFKLTSDIDLSDVHKANSPDEDEIYELLPYSCFSGNLDGDGHTIYCSHNSRTPLFYILENASFKNLTFDLSIRYVDKFESPLAVYHEMGNDLGLLCCEAHKNLTFTNCTFNGYVENREDSAGYKAKHIGGVIGIAKYNDPDKTIWFNKCTNNVEVQAKGTARHYAGGFIGLAEDDCRIVFNECTNNGSVTTVTAMSQIFTILISYGKMFLNILGSTFLDMITPGGKNGIYKSDSDYLESKKFGEIAKVEDYWETNDDVSMVGEDKAKWVPKRRVLIKVDTLNEFIDFYQSDTFHNTNLGNDFNDLWSQYDIDGLANFMKNNPELIKNNMDGNGYIWFGKFNYPGWRDNDNNAVEFGLSDYIKTPNGKEYNDVCNQINKMNDVIDKRIYPIDRYTKSFGSLYLQKDKNLDDVETQYKKVYNKSSLDKIDSKTWKKIRSEGKSQWYIDKQAAENKRFLDFLDNTNRAAYALESSEISYIPSEPRFSAVTGEELTSLKTYPKQEGQKGVVAQVEKTKTQAVLSFFKSIFLGQEDEKNIDNKNLKASFGGDHYVWRPNNYNTNSSYFKHDRSITLIFDKKKFKPSLWSLWTDAKIKLSKDYLPVVCSKFFASLPIINWFFGFDPDLNPSYSILTGERNSKPNFYFNKFGFGERFYIPYLNDVKDDSPISKIVNIAAGIGPWTLDNIGAQINVFTDDKKRFEELEKSFKYAKWVKPAFRFASVLMLSNIYLTNKFTRNLLSWNPWMQLASMINHKHLINDRNQKIGKLKINASVDEVLKKSLDKFKTYAQDNPDIYDELGFGTLDELSNSEYDSSDFEKNNDLLYSIMKGSIGDFFTKRFNYLTGNEELFWNVFNFDPYSNDEEINNLESVNDFLAMQGKLISKGKMPVACLLDGDDYNEFLSSVNGLIDTVKNLENNQSTENYKSNLYDKYIEIGKQYCQYCARPNDAAVKNLAYDVDNKVSMNAQRILRQACLALYYKLRNQTERWVNDDNHAKMDVKGAKILRNLMNGVYTDSFSYLNFLTEWGPQLYDEFETQMINYGIWGEHYNNASNDEKIKFIKHFFNTYITYSGEFSFNNYLPLMRAAVSKDNPNLYTIDFLSSKKELEINNIKDFVPDNENWKFTDKQIGYDYPIDYSILLECSMYDSVEGIQQILDYDYNANDFYLDGVSNNNEDSNTNISGLSDEESSVNNSVNNDDNAGFSGNMYSKLESLQKTLGLVAQSIPNMGITVLNAPFTAQAGGFIGGVDCISIEFNQCNNNGTITGGCFSAGFIGVVSSAKSISFNACCNLGSVICCDESELDPTAGGFIGKIRSSGTETKIDLCLSMGVVATKRAAGGFIGTPYGTIKISNSGCLAGIAAPRYCGGYFGIAEHASILSIKNCYAACVFDAVSNASKELYQIDFVTSTFGFSMPSFTTGTWTNRSYNNKPGILSGDSCSGSLDLDNFYYKQGEDLIGNGQNDRIVGRNKDNAHGVTVNEFSNGMVAYNLNCNAINPSGTKYDPLEDGCTFIQIIDDFSKGSKIYYPIPNISKIDDILVYQNYQDDKVVYSNFNTQFTQLHNVSLEPRNCNIEPDATNINVKHGDIFDVEVFADNAHQISSVYFEQPKDDESSGIDKVNLEKISGDKYNAVYRLSDICKSGTIHFDLAERDEVKPEGNGLDYDPYLIRTAEELHWFNKTMKQYPNTNVHVKLLNDIDFSGYVWEPLFSQQIGGGFHGSFDGNNHKITNINVNSNGSESGAFFNGVEGTYSNLLFQNEDNQESLDNILKKDDTKIAVPFDGDDYIYYLLQRFRNYGIDNKIIKYKGDGNKTAEQICLEKLRNKENNVRLCYVPDKHYNTSKLKIADSSGNHGLVSNLTLNGNFNDAAFAKSARDAKFINCISQGNVSGSGISCGGIVALATKNIEIVNCKNEATINYSSPDIYVPSCGGIVGCLTSEKYIYSDNVSKEKVYDLPDNEPDAHLNAEIKNCTNEGYVSGSNVCDELVNTGGIVGSISEVSYDASWDENFNSLNKTSKVFLQDSVYVLIDSCENFGNIGDSNNTHNSKSAGIICNIGYLYSKQSYKCDVVNCINYGKLGCDASGHETDTKACAGIVCTSNNDFYEDKEKQGGNYQISNNYTPVTKNLSSIKHGKNQVINCINLGYVRKRSGCDYAGQVCAAIGVAGMEIKGCAMTDSVSDAIGFLDGNADSVITNRIYQPNTYIQKFQDSSAEKVNKCLEGNRIPFEEEDLKSGKLTYELMNVNDNAVNGFTPRFGQNIDCLQNDKKVFARQYHPNILNENSQKVYKKADSNDYSKFTPEGEGYTNWSVESNEFNANNSIKININVQNENGENIEDTSCGTIKGYTKVRIDETNNIKSVFDIVGSNGHILTSLNFAGIDVSISKYNNYQFFIQKIDDQFFMDDKLLITDKDSDNYNTFKLTVKFGTSRKPNLIADCYQIKDSFELKWFAEHVNKLNSYDNEDDKLKTQNARLIDNIIILDDSYITPISENGEYQGTFTGGLDDKDGAYTITNYSSKPIFGTLGSNAKINNLVIDASFKIKEDNDIKWSSALASCAKGHDINITNVRIKGSINDEHNMVACDENTRAASFISLIDTYFDVQNNSEAPSSVFINNSTNNLTLNLCTQEIGGFIAKSNKSRVYINNCSNNAYIWNKSLNDTCNAGCIAYIIDDISDLPSKVDGLFDSNTNIKVCNFSNNAGITTSFNRNFSNNGGTGGVVGKYELTSNDDRANVDNEYANIKLYKCVNSDSISSGNSNGGIIGQAYSLRSNNFVSNIDLYGCENKSDLSILQCGKSVGGLLGYASGNFNLNIDRSLSNGDIKQAKSGHYLGGFVGFFDSPWNLNITNSSSYNVSLKSLPTDYGNSQIGKIIGTHNNYSQDKLNYENVYYMRQSDTDKANFIGNVTINDNDCVKTINDFKSGLIAYKLKIKDEDKSKDNKEVSVVIGQALDYNESVSEITPHIGSLDVFEPNVNIFSNYGNDYDSNVIVKVQPCDDSKSKEIIKNVSWPKDEMRWNLDIGVSDSCLKLGKLIINGNVFISGAGSFTAENNENSIFLHDLKYNLPGNMTSPFLSDKTIDLKCLNNLLLEKGANQDLIHPGLNSIEYSYDDVLEPYVIDYVFHQDKNKNDVIEKAYAITNADELLWFFDNSNDESKKKTNNIVLMEDIYLSGKSWEGHGKCFNNGRFFGQGHTIYDVTGKVNAFIENSENAEFRDINLDVDFTDKQAFSAFLVNANKLVLLDNISVTGRVDTANNFGGLVYSVYGNADYESDLNNHKSIFSNIDIPITESDRFAGLKGTRIKNCVNNLSNITGHFNYKSQNNPSIIIHRGGIVARVSDKANLSIESCINNANVKTVNYNPYDITGGIIGYVSQKYPCVSVYSCKNTKSVSGTYSGGIIGKYGRLAPWFYGASGDTDCYGNINIRYCDNLGNISGVVTGGILGCEDYAGKNNDKYTLFNIDSCINRGDIKCINSDRNNTACGGNNRAGGIVGLIWDGSNSYEYSKWNINHCGNVGVVDVNGDQPAGGIVGFEDSCKEIRVYNSYSIDEIYGDKSDYINGITGVIDDDGDFELGNVCLVGNRNLKIARAGEERFGKNLSGCYFSYSSMVNGELAYYLNEHNCKIANIAQDCICGLTEQNKYTMHDGTWGQKLDNYNNNVFCSSSYPEIGLRDTYTVYRVGTDWNTKFKSNDDMHGNWLQYSNDSLVFQSCYNNNRKNDNLYSNYRYSDTGINIHVWNKVYDSNTLKQRDTYHNFGNIQILDSKGNIFSKDVINKNCAKVMASDCNYYLSISNKTNEKREYSIVCKPTDGCMVSWISIDGKMRDRSMYNIEGCFDKFGNTINVIKTSELNDGNSHTIDVGFTDICAPKKIDDVYQISKYSELLYFSKLVNSGEASAKAALTNDIEASFCATTEGWTPIGSYSHPFTGSIDGKGHKIVGLARVDNNHVAFIRNANGATVKDLILEHVNFEATGDTADKADGGEEQAVAAVIARGEGITITNVEASGIIKSSGQKMGGIVGFINKGNSLIDKCVNKTVSNAASARKGRVGGIVGFIEYGTNTTIQNCTNYSNQRSNQYQFGASDWTTDFAGGIVGYCESHKGTWLNIFNCNNFGNIMGDSAGGILGDFADSISGSDPGAILKIQGCSNFANVCGDYCGGILGRIDDYAREANPYNIDWCMNLGAIGTGNYKIRCAGGIVGQLDDVHIKLNINYCTNTAPVYAGGGYTTNKTMEAFMITMNTLELYSFITGIAEYAVTDFSPINIARTVWNGIVFIWDKITTYVIQGRTTVKCRAGGIVGFIDKATSLNISNTINYGLVGALDYSNGVVSNITSSSIHTRNVCSVKVLDNTSGNHSKIGLYFISYNQLCSGEVAYNIQNSKKAGEWHNCDKVETSNFETEGNQNKVIRTVGNQKQTVYFGQSLDIIEKDKASRSTIPGYTYPSDDYKIYKYPDDFPDADKSTQRVFYTNIKNLTQITSQKFGTLCINGQLEENKSVDDKSKEEEKDSNEQTNKKRKNNLEENVDIKVTGYKSSGSIPANVYDDASKLNNSDTHLEKHYNMFPNESINIVLEPKSKFNFLPVQIKDIVLPNDENDCNSINNLFSSFENMNNNNENDDTNKILQEKDIYRFNDDGSFEYIKNPRYLLSKDKTEKSYIGCDSSYKKYNNGRVEIFLGSGVDSERKIDVSFKVVEGEPHIHRVSDTNCNIMFDAWSNKSIMPDIPGAYYLTEDIELNDDWVVPEGKIYLCLNGHKIHLNNNSKIDLNTNNSNLQICDCKHFDKSIKSKVININRENGSFDLVSANEDSNDEVIDGGIIYADEPAIQNSSSSNDGNEIFMLGSDSKLRIEDVNIIQRNNSKSAIYIKDDIINCNYELILNCKVYEAQNVGSIDSSSIIRFSSGDHPKLSNYESSKLFYGNNYKHCALDNSDNNQISDLLFNDDTNSNINIQFDSSYSFSTPITIYDNFNKHNTSVNLTTNFDTFISRGIKYTSAFSLFSKKSNSHSAIALTSLNDVVLSGDEDSKVDNKKYCNNICVCKDDDCSNVKIDIEGVGNIYPAVDVSEGSKPTILYKNDSKGKYYYSSSSISYMEDMKCCKCSDKDFDAVEKASISGVWVSIKAGTEVYTEHAVDQKINSFGSMYVDNVTTIQNWQTFTYGESSKEYKPLYNIKSDTTIRARFVCIKDSADANANWKLWNEDYCLPSESDLEGDQSIYLFKLNKDITLESTWLVPNAKIAIDLNGHTISPDKNSFVVKNENLIKVYGANSLLVINDYSAQSNNCPTRYFKKDDDGMYNEVSSSEVNNKGIISVTGGLIYGADTISNSEAAWMQSAGAICVDEGILVMNGGTVAFNRSTGRKGGAAITVKDSAKAYIYQGVSIHHNEMSGDIRYNSKDFAAGISSQGYTLNFASIHNNIAKSFAASAISVTNDRIQSTFDNYGNIFENYCYSDKDEKSNHKLDTYGAVYIEKSSTFNNGGIIKSNHADFENAAVVNDGSFKILGQSKVFENSWCSDINEDAQSDKWKKYDICLTSGNYISIDDTFKVEKGFQSVVLQQKGRYAITRGWRSVSNNIVVDDAFVPYVNDDFKFIFAHSPSDEIIPFDEDRVCKLDIWYFSDTDISRQSSDATINLNNSDKYICGVKYDMSVKLNSGFELVEIKVDKDKINPNNKNRFETNVIWQQMDNSKSEDAKIRVIPINISYEKEICPQDDQSTNYDTGLFEKWISKTSLPNTDGQFRLTNNVFIDETWTPAANCVLDLNGYGITITEKNKNIISLKNLNSNLTIIDSNRDAVHYIRQNKDNKTYSLENVYDSESNNVPIFGGYIAGASFEDADESGAIYVESGHLNLNSGNVVANVVNNNHSIPISDHGKGSCALFVGKDASVELGSNVNVSYNYSHCNNSSNEYGAAGIEVRGKLVSSATIRDNIGENHSVAGVAVISDGSTFENYGRISNNNASDNSVAALLVCSDNPECLNSNKVLAENYGKIDENVASNNSIAAVELYGKLLNAGWISKNIVKDTGSYAGIRAYGNLTLDGNNCQINQNIYKDDQDENNVIKQDIAFEEDNYDNYFVGSKSNWALFTLGANFDPPKLFNSNGENDASKPNSLIYVNVINYGTDDKLSKPLLLARGFHLDNPYQTMQRINSFFQVQDEKYCISATSQGDIYYSLRDLNANLYVCCSDGGSSDCQGVTTTSLDRKERIPVTIQADEGYYIKSITQEDASNQWSAYVDIPNNKKCTVEIINDSNIKFLNIVFEKINGFSVDVDVKNLEKEKIDASTYCDWLIPDLLPTWIGIKNFKLRTNVVLDEPWIVPEGQKMLIDLNGFNISLKDGSKGSVIKLTSKSTYLEIINSKATSNGSVVKFSVDKNTGKYIKDNNGDHVFNGGCIYGGNAVKETNSKDESLGKGGAIYGVKDSYVALHDVNVVGNSAEIGGAFYSEGYVVYNNLQEKILDNYRKNSSVVSGNYAIKGGAAYCPHGSGLLINGLVKDNVAKEQSAGLYCASILQIGRKFGCYNNKIFNESVASQSETIYEDVVLEEFKYNREKNAEQKGSILLFLSDVFNFEKKFIYFKCVSDEKNVLFHVAINEEDDKAGNSTIASGIYSVQKDGFHKLIAQKQDGEVYDYFTVEEQSWLNDRSNSRGR